MITRNTSRSPLGTIANVISAQGVYSHKMGEIKSSVLMCINMNTDVPGMNGLNIGAKDEHGNSVTITLDRDTTRELVDQLHQWFGTHSGSMQA